MIIVLLLSCFLAALVSFSSACLDVDAQREDVILLSPILRSDKYLPSYNCTYSITQMMPHGLVYAFVAMDIEHDYSFIRPCKSDTFTCKSQCTQDWVSILDSAGNEVTRRCGTNVPSQTYKTPPGPGIIWFRTDGSDERGGFTLRVTVDPDTTPCTSTNALKGESGELSNYMTSDRKYRANEDCKWLITVPETFDTIKITFKRVAIQGSCDGNSATCSCQNDWLTIFDGENERAPVLAQRCGFTAPFDPVFYTTRSTKPSLFAWFHSDATEEFPGFTFTYEGCNSPCGRVLPETTTPTSGFQWPNSNSLVAFWPLDHVSRLDDVSRHKLKCSKNCEGELDADTITGPFGDPSTSYHSKAHGQAILTEDTFIRSVPDQSYTISFFIRIPMPDAGGILSFVNNDGVQTFAIDVVSTTEGTIRPQLQVRDGPSRTAVVHQPYDVIWPGVWTFLAIVFDGNNKACTLAVYGKYGEMYMPAHKANLCSTNLQTKHLRLGLTTVDDKLSSLSPTSSISCVSIYSAPLTYHQILQVHDACRVAHKSAPCGAPRLPLPAIPAHPFGIPTYGHFPYIASLRRSIPKSPTRHVCAAAILDAYHLLTAATCFAETKEPFYYSVIVGEHILAMGDPYERRHAVSRISVPDFFNVSFANIAIVELSSPIEFSNPYANSICLPVELAKCDGRALFFGWGANGRPAESNSALPRYATGSLTECGSEWGQQFMAGYDVCFKSDSDDPNVPCGTGDEGGPLLVPADTINAKNARLVPVGVYGARLGNDCSKPVPALFTDIVSHKVRFQQIACNLPGFNYPDMCPIGYA